MAWRAPVERKPRIQVLRARAQPRLRLGVQQRSTPRIWLSTSTDLRELQS